MQTLTQRLAAIQKPKTVKQAALGALNPHLYSTPVQQALAIGARVAPSQPHAPVHAFLDVDSLLKEGNAPGEQESEYARGMNTIMDDLGLTPAVLSATAKQLREKGAAILGPLAMKALGPDTPGMTGPGMIEHEKLPITSPDVSNGMINGQPAGQVPGAIPPPMGMTAAPGQPPVPAGAPPGMPAAPQPNPMAPPPMPAAKVAAAPPMPGQTLAAPAPMSPAAPLDAAVSGAGAAALAPSPHGLAHASLSATPGTAVGQTPIAGGPALPAPKSTPASNPINSYGALSMQGEVNGNASFGTANSMMPAKLANTQLWQKLGAVTVMDPKVMKAKRTFGRQRQRLMAQYAGVPGFDLTGRLASIAAREQTWLDNYQAKQELQPANAISPAVSSALPMKTGGFRFPKSLGALKPTPVALARNAATIAGTPVNRRQFLQLGAAEAASTAATRDIMPTINRLSTVAQKAAPVAAGVATSGVPLLAAPLLKGNAKTLAMGAGAVGAAHTGMGVYNHYQGDQPLPPPAATGPRKRKRPSAVQLAAVKAATVSCAGEGQVPVITKPWSQSGDDAKVEERYIRKKGVDSIVPPRYRTNFGKSTTSSEALG